jgi:carboxypeptidase-like protein
VRRSLLMTLAALIPAIAGGQTPAPPSGSAVFTGTIVDSLKHPLPNAEVVVPGLSLTRATDDGGSFRITGIPAGTHRVTVRRIGFGQLDTSITFADDHTVHVRITLGNVVRLDSVVVTERKGIADLVMQAFEESRAKGFGRFVTRDQLEKQSGVTVGSIVASLQGVAGFRGTAGQLWVASKRSPRSRCPPVKLGETPRLAAQQQRVTDDCLRSERLYYVPEDFEALQGMTRGCYAVVYLDRNALNATHPVMPFDLNTFLPTQLEAIEWYESEGAVPSIYNAADARCGLLVLHQRR